MNGKRERVKTPEETQDAARLPACQWGLDYRACLLKEERNEGGKERAGIGREGRRHSYAFNLDNQTL